MKLRAFRIKNFRSIRDTNWQNLSSDNITGLIGQNEAGKTAILEALYSFSTTKISEDFLRSDGTMPEVSCSFQTDWEEIEKLFEGTLLPLGLDAFINEKKRLNLRRTWNEEDYASSLVLEEEGISDLFKSIENDPSQEAIADEQTDNSEEVNNEIATDNQIDETENTESPKEPEKITEKEFVDIILETIPKFRLFEDFSSLLPDTIDLEDLRNKNKDVQGYKGAENLLILAEFKFHFLSNNMRMIENKIEGLNKKVTGNFRDFWSQRIGKENKIFIEFGLKNYDDNQGEKAGKPYIVFWISDEEEKLHPKQRSNGVRWFTSFYLQLKASGLHDNTKQVFLIDEPGGSLHARAQKDVIKVFEDIAGQSQIIYTTHSPYLIDSKKIRRLLAVQRAGEDDDRSDTQVFDAHKLGQTSSDTLSPIYTAMGIDFSNQQVIKKSNNVLLEEISAHYYLLAFWKLVGSEKEVHFLPATGASNIPQLANLFLGWGLDFCIVVDDDSAGRRIYNELRRNIFEDSEDKAKKKILKIKDTSGESCRGIEDLFTNNDFKKYVFIDENVPANKKNSEFMKDKSKAIYASQFMNKVENREIKISELDEITQNNIKNLVEKIKSLLR